MPAEHTQLAAFPPRYLWLKRLAPLVIIVLIGPVALRYVMDAWAEHRIETARLALEQLLGELHPPQEPLDPDKNAALGLWEAAGMVRRGEPFQSAMYDLSHVAPLGKQHRDVYDAFLAANRNALEQIVKALQSRQAQWQGVYAPIYRNMGPHPGYASIRDLRALLRFDGIVAIRDGDDVRAVRRLRQLSEVANRLEQHRHGIAAMTAFSFRTAHHAFCQEWMIADRRLQPEAAEQLRAWLKRPPEVPGAYAGSICADGLLELEEFVERDYLPWRPMPPNLFPTGPVQHWLCRPLYRLSLGSQLRQRFSDTHTVCRQAMLIQMSEIHTLGQLAQQLHRGPHTYRKFIHRATTHEWLNRVALAAILYRHDNDAWPTSVADLPPDFRATMPTFVTEAGVNPVMWTVTPNGPVASVQLEKRREISTQRTFTLDGLKRLAIRLQNFHAARHGPPESWQDPNRVPR